MDHPWMRALAKASCSYRPPVDLKTLDIKASSQTATRKSAQLHHAAPEVGHSLTLHRQPVMLTLNRRSGDLAE